MQPQRKSNKKIIITLFYIVIITYLVAGLNRAQFAEAKDDIPIIATAGPMFIAIAIAKSQNINHQPQREITIRNEMVIEITPSEKSDNKKLKAKTKAKSKEDANEHKLKLEDAKSNTSVLTKAKGVNYYNGHKETWYSERVLPGGGLKIPGRHSDDAGLVRDGDGYICVASSDYTNGKVVKTSLGMGKVYDCGCESGVIDIYTNW